jgi:hypothetical protein
MSKLGPKHRSYLPISYADRILCTALCQGAALHYLNGEAVVQDFDVYTFYAQHPARRWYARRRAVYDFGAPKFGQSADRLHFVGRRVNVWGRAIPAEPGDNPVAAVRAYLAVGATETARRLAQKAVVLLAPAEELGTIVWS